MMDIDYESLHRNDDILKWTSNRAVAWRLRWLKMNHQGKTRCSRCRPHRNENVSRNVYPRWKRLREKAKSQRKGRC